jgi:hypothetical protein
MTINFHRGNLHRASSLKGKRGVDLLRDPELNKSTIFTEEERDSYGVSGLLRSGVHSKDTQVQRLRPLRPETTWKGGRDWPLTTAWLSTNTWRPVRLLSRPWHLEAPAGPHLSASQTGPTGVAGR